MAEPRVFTYQEALETFPTVRDRTEAAVRSVEALYGQLSGAEDPDQVRQRLEGEINEIVQRWAEDLRSMGCEVKGLWLVDWDSGDGYYCWRYPEETIGYFHSYEEGFAGRMPIA